MRLYLSTVFLLFPCLILCFICCKQMYTSMYTDKPLFGDKQHSYQLNIIKRSEMKHGLSVTSPETDLGQSHQPEIVKKTENLNESLYTGKDNLHYLQVGKFIRHNETLWKQIAQNSDKQKRNVDISQPTLTLFTTMKELSHRRNIHLNTMKNWAKMSPALVPVLFVRNVTEEKLNTSSLGYIATTYGFHLLEYTETKQGIPILKSMFQNVNKLGLRTLFIGYSNADIMFDSGLLLTLTHFGKAAYINKDSENIFLTGRRRNVGENLLKLVGNAENPDHITVIGQEFDLFKEGSADYFITTPHGINWTAVPDFVVGRQTYDGWLLAAATLWGLTHLDMSETVTALHQTGIDGNHAGATTNNDTRLINRDIIGDSLRLIYSSGRHECAPLYSTFNQSCIIMLQTDCINIKYRDPEIRSKRCRHLNENKKKKKKNTSSHLKHKSR